jgi:archaemetzincin
MKILLAILMLTALQTNCRKHSIISSSNSNGQNVIALQPLEDYDTGQLTTASKEISIFFNTRVLILAPVNVPQSFYSTKNYPGNDGYFADSLLPFLSKFINDTIVKVVGITHRNIYTLKKFTVQVDKKRSVLYGPYTIFGLGYVGGNTSVVSDYRLQSVDRGLFENRLKKVILHELGHNFGLSHCRVDSCLMSETNGDIVKLNKTGGNYCKQCRQKLNW